MIGLCAHVALGKKVGSKRWTRVEGANHSPQILSGIMWLKEKCGESINM